MIGDLLFPSASKINLTVVVLLLLDSELLLFSSFAKRIHIKSTSTTTTGHGQLEVDVKLLPRFPSHNHIAMRMRANKRTPPPEQIWSSYYHNSKKKYSKNHNNNTTTSRKLPPYETKYCTQILDHFNFNPESYQTFQQRYLINDEYFYQYQYDEDHDHEKNPAASGRPNPIFVYMGNEGDIEWFASNTGLMYEIAPRFNALLVFIEHRFYGKSIPYDGNKSVAYSNASTQGYLTSTQALADYATLILDLKKNLSAINSPVVVFGGSYGGMLAAWFRLKYPHVAAGALASSSPILNFENITSPFTFNNIITHDFKSESENCYKVIKDSWQQIADTAASKPGGLDDLSAEFHICQSSSISANSLSNWLREAYIYTAMTDYPTPSSFLSPLPAYPIKEMCKVIDDQDAGRNDTIFTKLYRAVSIYYNYTGNVKHCFNLDDSYDTHGLSEWTWQACTEMVLSTGGNDENSIFPASEDDYESWAAYCKSLYGIEPRPHWILTEFGGHDIKRVLKRHGSNIIFFNGFRDPWSGGGVRSSISESIIAIVAEEGAHHVDLRFSTKEDPDWLKHVRETEVRVIGKWLSDYYNDLVMYPSDD